MCAQNYLCFSLVVLLLVSQVSFIEVQGNSDGYKYIDQVQKALPSLYPDDVFEVLPKLLSANSTSTSSVKCYEQVKLLVNGTRNGAMWALKMIDASSKIPSGILMGNRIDLGMYDECMNIKEIVSGEEIRGRHCMYKIKASLRGISMEETLSICLPSSCQSVGVKLMLEATLEIISDSIDVDFQQKIVEATCSSIGATDWTIGDIVTLIGFGLLLLFLVVCTICDIFVRRSGINLRSNNGLGFLSQFSIYSNAIRVLSTKTTPQTLPALQGLRFFSMCWVIFGHEYFMASRAATINLMEFFKWVHTWNALYIIIAPFSVDTFFTISGFLMSYLFLKEMATGRKFNIFSYYLHRYLRLTPTLMALLLMTIFILPRVGSGAIWETSMNDIAKICRHSWWSMLLYVQNYVDFEDRGCLPHTWYLAVEMHLFWISPLILYPLAKKPKFGLIILALTFVASIITPAVISYKNEYSGYIVATGNITKSAEVVANFYMKTHIRATPWLIGVFLGYLVFIRKGSPRKVTKWIGWLLTIIAFAFCFFIMRKFQAKGYVFDAAWEIFYVVVSKPFWSGAVAWIIYTSICSFGGPITTFLSYSIYNPFCRISYCVYLVHFSLQIMKASAARVPRYFNEFSFFNDFLSDFVLSLGIGFVFTLVFESPILILEKIVRKRSERKLNGSKEKLENEELENGSDNLGVSNNENAFKYRESNLRVK